MDKQPTIINVCNGPGCNAWDAPEILKDLPESILNFGENIKVCEVPCINSCGGGVSIHVNEDSENVIKVRKPCQAIDKILPSIASPVRA